MGMEKYKADCIGCSKFSEKLYYCKDKKQARADYLCKECYRWVNLERTYGLSKTTYLQMYNAQKGACAICKTPEMFCAPVGPTKKRMLVVDHDHDTGRVRALLCHNCNTAVGVVGENPKIAQALVRYLKIHK